MPIRAIRTTGGIGAQGSSGGSSNNAIQVTFSGSLGAVGSPYIGSVSASGGTAPYAYAVSAGSLPGGLTLNSSTGAITGTPTTAGTYSFQLQATDSVANTAAVNCSIMIAAANGPLELSFSGANAQYGIAFNAALVAVGGTQPYTYAISTGSLPPGLSLNTTTGNITGTPTTAGIYNFTARVTDSVSATKTVNCTISVTYFDVPDATVTAASAIEAPNSVYQDQNGGLHFVITITATLTASLYPVRTRVWIDYDDGNGWTLQGDQFAASGAASWSLGGQTQQTGVTIPGTIWVPTDPAKINWKIAVEANSHAEQPTLAAATSTFAVEAVPAATANEITNAYLVADPSTGDQLTYALDHLGLYRWQYYQVNWLQPTTSAKPYYWFSALTVQLGYAATGTCTVSGGVTITTAAPLTVPAGGDASFTAADVGMEIHIGSSLRKIVGYIDANNVTIDSAVSNGAFQSCEVWRHAPVTAINGQQGTDENIALYRGRRVTDADPVQADWSIPTTWVLIPGPHPPEWGMPPSTLLNDTPNPYRTFRLRIYAWTRRAANPGGGSGSSALQAAWQTGTADHYDVTPTIQQAALDLSQTNPVTSFDPLSPITGGGGTKIDLSVTGPLTKIAKQLTVAPLGIDATYMANQAVLARTMAANAVTYANSAIAANAVVDSNVASVQLGKLISGTVIFSGDIALARGNGAAVVTMNNTGIFLYSACTASGGGVTPGAAGSPTYSASGLTSSPYVGIQAAQVGVFSGGSGPSVTIAGGGVNLWSANGSTASPYGSLTSSGLWFYYSSLVYATIQSTGFAVYNGANYAQLGSLGLGIYSGNYKLEAFSVGVQITYIPTGYYAQVNASGILLAAGNYTLQAYATGLKFLYTGGASAVLTNLGLTFYSVDGNAGFPYVTITSTSVTIYKGVLNTPTITISSGATTVNLDATNFIKLTNTAGGTAMTYQVGPSLTGAQSSTVSGYVFQSFGAYLTCGIMSYNGSLAYGTVGPGIVCYSLSYQYSILDTTGLGVFGPIGHHTDIGYAGLYVDSVKVIGQQVNGPGNPSFFSLADAQFWCQSLLNGIRAHGFMT